MKIKSISGNLKGREFAFDLDDLPVQFFYGENGVGKTSIAVAINLALRGYEPTVAKSKAAANDNRHRRLSGVGGVVEALVTMDDDSKFHYLLDGKGKSHSTARDLTDLETRLLDPAAFFDVGPSDRMKYILSVAPNLPPVEEVRDRLLRGTGIPNEVREAETVIDYLDAFMKVQRGEIRVKKAELAKATGALEECEATIQELDAELGDRRVDGDPSKMIEMRSKMEGQLEALKSEDLTIPDLVTLEEPPSEAELEEASIAVGALEGNKEHLADRRGELRGKIEKFKEKLELAERGTCPTCGAVTELPDEERDELESLLNEVHEDMRDATARSNEIPAKLRDARDELASLKDKVSAYSRNLEHNKRAEKKKEVVLERLEKIKGLEKGLEELGSVAEYREIDRLNTRIGSEEDRAKEIRSEIELLEKTIEERTELGKAAKAEREALMKGALESVIAPGAESAANVFPWFKIEIDEKGNLGYFVEKDWIAFETWSGSELAAAYMALAVSIASLSDGLKLIVIDEFARFSPKAQIRLLQELGDLYADERIDQAIVLSPSDCPNVEDDDLVDVVDPRELT